MTKGGSGKGDAGDVEGRRPPSEVGASRLAAYQMPGDVQKPRCMSFESSG